MTDSKMVPRREMLAGLAGVGTMLVAGCAHAQPKQPAHAHDATPAAPLSPALQAVIASTSDCARAGRRCLARCTEHLAAGTPMMADCQRAVMNMLAVVQAMADVAGYANASPEHVKMLASTCASFCRACAAACEPHAAHHEECKACRDACLACAKACEAV